MNYTITIWGGIELMYAHGFPVRPKMAHRMGLSLMSCKGLSHQALCTSDSLPLQICAYKDIDMFYSLTCDVPKANLLETVCMQPPSQTKPMIFLSTYLLRFFPNSQPSPDVFHFNDWLFVGWAVQMLDVFRQKVATASVYQSEVAQGGKSNDSCDLLLWVVNCSKV